MLRGKTAFSAAQSRPTAGPRGVLRGIMVAFFLVAALAPAAAKAGQRPAPRPSPAAPVGEPLPKFEGSRASVSELRGSLIGLLNELEREPSVLGESQRDAAILKLLGTYRTQGIPGSATIADSSYLKVIISEVLKQFPRPCSPEDFAERERERAGGPQSARLAELKAAADSRELSDVEKAELRRLDLRLSELERCNAELERRRISEVRETPYDVLLDRALAAYISVSSDPNADPEVVRLLKPFSAAGPCVAARVIAVGDAHRLALLDPSAPRVSCPLDNSSDLPSRGLFAKFGGLFQLLFTKVVGCPLRIHVPADCKLRKLVFDEAKADLIRARENPAVQNFQNTEFNRAVRTGLVTEINARARDYNEDLAAKVGGSVSSLLVPGAPLVERSPEAGETMSLRDLVQGLHADIAAAVLLHRSTDPVARGAAGALLYAAANRALLVVGGERGIIGKIPPEAQDPPAAANAPSVIGWMPGVVGSTPGQNPRPIYDRFDAADPGRIPRLAKEPFGGVGFGLSNGQLVAGPWDFDAGYSPTDCDTSRSPAVCKPFRLFPSEFTLSAAGIGGLVPGRPTDPRAATESLRDLGDFLSVLTYFLKVTGPGGELSRYFVADDQFAVDLGDRTRPALFPKRGRELLYGLAAAALQNLAAPFFGNRLGHLEQVGSGLKFREVISLDPADPRMSEPATTIGVSRLLLAAKDFKSLIGDPAHPETMDPDLPAALREDLNPILSSVNTALLLGHTLLAGGNPCPDGGFGSRVSSCLPVAGANGRGLEDAVNALRAITVIYNDIEQDVILLKIEQAWQYLDGFWRASAPNSFVPVEILGLGPQPVQPSRMWPVLALWHDTQIRVRGRLQNRLPWAVWETRMEGLRRRLLDQLASPDGPKPLVP
jgi:hypothetical protein